MKKNTNAYKTTITAIIGALYVALGLIFSAISFGPIQVRVSAMLYQLIPYNKKYFWALILGTAILNVFSPLGWYDMVFGVATSAVGLGVSVGLNHFVKNMNARRVVDTICICLATVFVAWELVLVAHVPFFATWLTVAAGQLIAQVAGMLLMAGINKRINLSKAI